MGCSAIYLVVPGVGSYYLSSQFGRFLADCCDGMDDVADRVVLMVALSDGGRSVGKDGRGGQKTKSLVPLNLITVRHS